MISGTPEEYCSVDNGVSANYHRIYFSMIYVIVFTNVQTKSSPLI